MKFIITVLSLIVLSVNGFAAEKVATKTERAPASAMKKRLGCPDGGGYFTDKDKWIKQIEQIMASAQYCTDAVKLAEKCGGSTPVLLATTTTEAAQRCARDFSTNDQDKQGYTALTTKCDDLFRLGNGALAKWSVGQCYLNAAVFYSDLFNSRKDLTE